MTGRTGEHSRGRLTHVQLDLAPMFAVCASPMDHVVMDSAEVASWFATYLQSFAALARREVDDVGLILDHYGVPLTISTDEECVILTEEAQVIALAKQQFDDLQADGYESSVVLEAESTILNRSCVAYRGRFARVRVDGTEISRIESTYLIVNGPLGLRISTLVRHTPQAAL